MMAKTLCFSANLIAAQAPLLCPIITSCSPILSSFFIKGNQSDIGATTKTKRFFLKKLSFKTNVQNLLGFGIFLATQTPSPTSLFNVSRTHLYQFAPRMSPPPLPGRTNTCRFVFISNFLTFGKN